MSTRGARYTIETGKREHFSDFLTNFDKNPITGYLAKAVDQQAIETSLRNIILTNRGDWPFESTLGSTVKRSLFDLGDSRLLGEIESSISETITNNEPRVSFKGTTVRESAINNNTINITIIYSILNIPDEVFSFDISVTRVR